MDAAFLPARVRDLAERCERTAVPCFLGFLTPSEAATAQPILKNIGCKYRFFGGYDGAERTVLAVFPDWCDDPVFPFGAVTLNYRTCDRLTHRDFLGALMALGIVRESVGDILCESGRTVIFVRNEVARFVTEQLKKVGACGVTVYQGAETPLPQCSEKSETSDTVASLRLDCVVAALCGCSRKTAAEYIADGKVSIHSVACEKPTKTVVTGETITIRGIGKFIIGNTDAVSKKGRIILRYSKYN